MRAVYEQFAGKLEHWGCPAFVDTMRVTRKEAATMPNTHRPYAPEFRQQMVDLVRSGRTPEQLAQEYEPSAGAIRNWVAQRERDAGQREDGLGSDERQDLRRLRRENKQLRIEPKSPTGWDRSTSFSRHALSVFTTSATSCSGG